MQITASLPICQYRLDMPIDGLPGLTEFSETEYAIYGRPFESETNYNAPGIEFLGRRWSVALGTVDGVIYKVALFFETESRDTAVDVSTAVMCLLP